MKEQYLSIIILLLLFIINICITYRGIRGDRRSFRGGQRKKLPQNINNASIIYLKVQKIAKLMSDDQLAKTHSTWGESFFFGYMNNLFLNGWNNKNKFFPLVPDCDMIYKTLKDIAYWSEYKDEKITAEKILNIIESKDTKESDKNKLLTLIPCNDLDILQQQYPKVSKDEIKALIIRYGAAENNPDLKDDIKLSSAYLSLPPPVYKYYDTTFKKCVECFASPINHTLDTYCSIFKDDMKFGAIGPFTEKTVEKDKESYYIANPPYDRVSLHLASKVVTETPCAYTSLLFPCKDGGLFHFYGKRYLKKKDYYAHSRLDPDPKHLLQQKMIPSINSVIKSSHFSGMLIIPRELMRYWNYGRRETKAITYDTIIMYSFRGDTSPTFYKFLEQVLWRILLYGYKDICFWMKHHGFPKKVIELDKLKEEYKEKFSKDTSDKLIKSAELIYKIIDEFEGIITNNLGQYKIENKLIDKKIGYELI